MRIKVIFILLIILLLIGAAVADAKSSGRGGRSGGSGSKSLSSIKTTYSGAKDSAKSIGLASIPGFGKKRILHDADDILENETEEEMEQQMPGFGALSALISLGIISIFAHKRRTNR